ncbi:MAG: Crp/Fnr family transcriptional regulator [Beijerinckiaceae bacterium]
MSHPPNPGQRNRLLAALSPVDFALLASDLREVRYKQGALLQEAGEPIKVVYFPQTGMISLLAVMQAGNGVETATVGCEGAVGIMAGLGGRTAVGRAVVQVAGISSHITASRFLEAANASAGIRELIGRYYDTQMTLVHQSAGCYALNPVTARLCRWLLQTRDRSDSDILSLTHEFLAAMLGVQRTTVTSLARALQDLGLVRYRRGKIEIVDRLGLESKACECYEVVQRKTEEVFSIYSSFPPAPGP